MDKKICGISKRHFRRCVKNEKKNIINKITCEIKKNSEVDCEKIQDAELQCAKNGDDGDANDDHEQMQLNIDENYVSENEKYFSDSEIHNYIVSLLVKELKEIIEKNEATRIEREATQTTLLRRIAAKIFAQNEDEHKNIKDSLPIANEEQLAAFNKKLQEDPVFKSGFINYIKQAKGKQQPSKIFQLLIVDELANEYNWWELKGKKCFQTHEHFVQALFESFKNPKFGMVELAEELKLSLKNANLRIIKKRCPKDKK